MFDGVAVSGLFLLALLIFFEELLVVGLIIEDSLLQSLILLGVALLTFILFEDLAIAQRVLTHFHVDPHFLKVLDAHYV